MRRKKTFHARQLLLLLPLLACLFALGIDFAPLQKLRLQVFDQYQRWSPRPYEEMPVRIVDIDDASLARLGQWPWPRTRLAELVDRLEKLGVAAIAFDSLFAESDRSSPAEASRQWPLTPALQQGLQGLPDHDQLFAQRLRQKNVAIGFVLEAEDKHPNTANLPQSARFIELGEGASRRLHRFQGAIRALPVLESAAQGYGAINFVADSDGVLRRVPLLFSYRGETVAGLTAEALRVAQETPNIVLRAAGDQLGLSEIRIGEVNIPTTPQGEFWVHFSPPVNGRYLPAWQVLAGRAPPEALAGHIVLIGSSAQGLMDLRFNPLGRIMPGVEIHAQALEQILAGHFLQRPGWAQAAEALALLLGGLLIAGLTLRLRVLHAASALLLLLAASTLGSWLAFREAGLLLDPAGPSLGILLTFASCSLYRHRLNEHESRWIREAFSRYVSPNRVNYLIEHPEALELGGRRQIVSFVATDLADFTPLLESSDPGQIVSLLNAYLDGMLAIAFRHEGTIDRIVGDAVAVVFSAPVEQADHAERALACALEMNAFARQHADTLRAQGIPFGHTRIGVHTGEVIVGNFGGAAMFDYRALGDAVNTTARLETVNKHLGTHCCISEATLAGCPDAAVRPVARLILKGKQEALATYEPLAAAVHNRYAPLADYLAAYAALREKRDEATARFAILHAAWPEDPLVRLHYGRLQAGESGDLIVMAQK